MDTVVERVGGHRGMNVDRHLREDGTTFIRKQAMHELGNSGQWHGIDLYDHNVKALRNEGEMLIAMRDSGFTPRFLEFGDDYLDQEDVGVSQIPQDAEAWRRNLIKQLCAIRSRGLRHGDLKGANIITRKDWSWAVDWQEGHRLADPAPQRQPFSDSYLMMQHIEGTADASGRFDIPRVARRWRAVLGALGATMDVSLPLKGRTFLDLGCFQGDFVALAAAEGMTAAGVDKGGFRSGENSIAIARTLWRDLRFGELHFRERDITEGLDYQADIVMMFSTWPYIVRDYGKTKAIRVLERVIKDAGVFFFETQLAGDGPGPEFLRTDGDVHDMLIAAGGKEVKPLAIFPVTGRSAARMVWRVQR